MVAKVVETVVARVGVGMAEVMVGETVGRWGR